MKIDKLQVQEKGLFNVNVEIKHELSTSYDKLLTRELHHACRNRCNWKRKLKEEVHYASFRQCGYL